MRIYFMAAIAAVVCCAYWAGLRIGREQCRADAARVATDAQTQILQQQRKIDAETYNRGTGDIRRVLREKYTIAQ